MTRGRFLLLLLAVLAGSSVLYQSVRRHPATPVYLLRFADQWRGANYHDYGYFLWQATIIDRLGSPWDQAIRDAADRQFAFPHTISVAHYLPSWFILLIPLSRLDYATGARLWTLLSAASLLVALWFLARWFLAGLPRGMAAGVALLLAGFYYPITFTLGAGQNNLIVLGCIVLGMALLRRSRPVAAGFPLALAAIGKIIPVVLFFPLLLRREWRGFAAGIALFLALNLLALAWFPPSVFVDCYQAIRYKMATDAHCPLSFSVYSLVWRAIPDGRSVRTDAGRWVPDDAAARWKAAHAKTAAGAASNLFFLGAVALAARATLRRRAWDWAELLAFWSVVFLLGSAFLGEAHLVYALPALVVELGRALRDPAGYGRARSLLLLLAVGLLGVEYYPHGLAVTLAWPGSLLLNLKLLGVLLLFGLQLRR